MKKTIAQAAVLVLLGTAAGLVNNALSVNGIDPFRRIGDVPVFEEGDSTASPQSSHDHDGVCIISLDELRRMLDAGDVVIDARTREEYESGHIPGAVLCDYFEMGSYLDRVLPLLSPDDRIGVYCSGPQCDDSEMLARELYSMGYRKLCVFKGGMEEWTERGLPVESGPGEEWE